MSKQKDAIAFYKLLDELERRIGGKLLLADLRASDAPWLQKPGVYFMFEPGETRSGSGEGPRVTRVGITSRPLRKRLEDHRGTRNGGNHRRSILRRHFGKALMHHDQIKDIDIDRWNWNNKRLAKEVRMNEFIKTSIKESEQPLEEKISQHICQMSIICVPVVDKTKREHIERNAIALLSEHSGAIDPSSKKWLGRYCPNEQVQSSGLWNSNHVDEDYDPEFLNVFERLINAA